MAQIQGMQEALRELGAIDKNLQKAYRQRAKDIMAPGVAAVQAAMPANPPLSGMRRQWHPQGRKVQLGRYNVGRIKRGIKPRVSLSKRARTSLAIVISSPLANIIEFAGTNPNPMGDELTARFRAPARFAWPAFMTKRDEIRTEVMKATYDVSVEISRRLAK